MRLLAPSAMRCYHAHSISSSGLFRTETRFEKSSGLPMVIPMVINAPNDSYWAILIKSL